MNLKAMGIAWRIQIHSNYESELRKVSYFAITEKDIYVAKNGNILSESLPLEKIKNVCLENESCGYFLKKEDAMKFLQNKIAEKQYDLYSKMEELKKSLEVIEYSN
ncbi:MAG: hypothetical protein ACPG5B_06875 [Chitinophagales bacterium]